MLKRFLKTGAVLLLTASVALAGCGGNDAEGTTGGGRKRDET